MRRTLAFCVTPTTSNFVKAGPRSVLLSHWLTIDVDAQPTASTAAETVRKARRRMRADHRAAPDKPQSRLREAVQLSLHLPLIWPHFGNAFTPALLAVLVSCVSGPMPSAFITQSC